MINIKSTSIRKQTIFRRNTIRDLGFDETKIKKRILKLLQRKDEEGKLFLDEIDIDHHKIENIIREKVNSNRNFYQRYIPILIANVIEIYLLPKIKEESENKKSHFSLSRAAKLARIVAENYETLEKKKIYNIDDLNMRGTYERDDLRKLTQKSRARENKGKITTYYLWATRLEQEAEELNSHNNFTVIDRKINELYFAIGTNQDAILQYGELFKTLQRSIGVSNAGSEVGRLNH